MTEIIVEKDRNGDYVKVEKVSPGFPEFSYFRVTTERGVVLDNGTAEDALRALAKYMV